MTIPVDELQALVEEVHGKRPVERKFSAVVTVAAVVRGSAVLYKSEKFDIAVIPEAPFISSAYYLIGGMNDWDPEKAKDFKFSHSGKDVYEDPVFTITFTAGDECWWKIVPQSNYDAGDAWAKGSTGVVGNGYDGGGYYLCGNLHQKEGPKQSGDWRAVQPRFLSDLPGGASSDPKSRNGIQNHHR